MHLLHALFCVCHLARAARLSAWPAPASCCKHLVLHVAATLAALAHACTMLHHAMSGLSIPRRNSSVPLPLVPSLRSKSVKNCAAPAEHNSPSETTHVVNLPAMQTLILATCAYMQCDEAHQVPLVWVWPPSCCGVAVQ
jgi:hypothetical protein